MKLFLRTALLAVTLGVAACRGGSHSEAGALDREVFIATYVDLRAAAIRAEGMVLSDAERAEVLARHGVTEEQLVDFARLHGQDVEFMRTVWDEVEARMDGERVLPDGDAG